MCVFDALIVILNLQTLSSNVWLFDSSVFHEVALVNSWLISMTLEILISLLSIDSLIFILSPYGSCYQRYWFYLPIANLMKKMKIKN